MQSDAVYELEASKVHILLVLQMLRRQNKKVFFVNAKQCAETDC